MQHPRFSPFLGRLVNAAGCALALFAFGISWSVYRRFMKHGTPYGRKSRNND